MLVKEVQIVYLHSDARVGKRLPSLGEFQAGYMCSSGGFPYVTLMRASICQRLVSSTQHCGGGAQCCCWPPEFGHPVPD